MSEEMKKEEAVVEEKKPVVAYTIKRYEDGSVDGVDAGIEGTEKMTSEEIYKDIEEVARIVANKRVENAAFVGAYNGTAKFYKDVQAAKEEPAEIK